MCIRLVKEKKYRQVINLLEIDTNYLEYPDFYRNLGDSYFGTNEYGKAEYAYLKASNMIPNSFTYKYLLAKFYFDTNQFPKAMATAQIILTMAAKIPSSAVEDIRNKAAIILLESRNKIQRQ